MVLLRYTCKTCGWHFILDLENMKDSLGRPIDRRAILHKHLKEGHDITIRFDSFTTKIHNSFRVSKP